MNDPFRVLVRLHAILRRANVGSDQPCLKCNGLEIDLAVRVVRTHGEKIRLTPTEFRLLDALLGNRGRLMTHDSLLRHAWGAAYTEDRQTLRAHIANLRRKLGSTDEHSLIRTYPGVGYLFDDSNGERSATRANTRSLSKHGILVATHDAQHPRPERAGAPARRLAAAAYRRAA
jgi:DNA-binding response OmpR family regulator